ncbi:MAG TPA: class F sortase [Tepidiformaceae bacterium]|nr:class F sortase [Tepidiformaceae bacterium]
MRSLRFGMLATAAELLLGSYALGIGFGAAEANSTASSGLAHELRYIGRDPLTGMAVRVDDRFIAQVEESIARYGQDARQPVPPPPAGERDLSRVSIPALGLSDVVVGRYGLDAFGRLDVPQDASTIGWNPAYNALPGEGGGTFLAAHYEYAGRPGVFHRLSSMRNGDEVLVTLSDGSVYEYRVTSVVDYALGSIDMGALLHAREGVESITLMTCSGPPSGGEYWFRTVVLAERVD